MSRLIRPLLLAGRGREIVVYDRVGSGMSDRLADPIQYAVAHHVADLPTTVHDPARVRGERMRGMGGWVQVMTDWDQLARAPDPPVSTSASPGAP